jgi:hypothetical protein
MDLSMSVSTALGSHASADRVRLPGSEIDGSGQEAGNGPPRSGLPSTARLSFSRTRGS